MIRQETLSLKQDDLTYVLNHFDGLNRFFRSMRKIKIAWKISNGCCSRCISSRELKLRELYHATVNFLNLARAQNQALNDAKHNEDGEASFLDANRISE